MRNIHVAKTEDIWKEADALFIAQWIVLLFYVLSDET